MDEIEEVDRYNHIDWKEFLEFVIRLARRAVPEGLPIFILLERFLI